MVASSDDQKPNRTRSVSVGVMLKLQLQEKFSFDFEKMPSEYMAASALPKTLTAVSKMCNMAVMGRSCRDLPVVPINGEGRRAYQSWNTGITQVPSTTMRSESPVLLAKKHK